MLDVGHRLTVKPRDPKQQYAQPPLGWGYGNQLVNGILSQVQLTVGMLVPLTHPVIPFPVPEYITRMDTLGCRQSLHTLQWESQVEVSETALPHSSTDSELKTVSDP